MLFGREQGALGFDTWKTGVLPAADTMSPTEMGWLYGWIVEVEEKKVSTQPIFVLSAFGKEVPRC